VGEPHSFFCPLKFRLCLPTHPPRPCKQTDRRALNITLNSIGTELTRDDRKKLYSNFGQLYPHGHNELSAAEDFDQIRAAMEKVPAYAMIFSKVRHWWWSWKGAPLVCVCGGGDLKHSPRRLATQ
jgi:hypothetical protein